MDVPIFDGRQGNDGPMPHVAHVARLAPNVRRLVVASVTRILFDDADDQVADVRPVQMIKETNLIQNETLKSELQRLKKKSDETHLAGIKVGRGRVAVILGRRRESGALKNGRVAQLSRFRHVNIDVHPRAVFVRVVVTGTRLRSRSRSIVPSPVQIVA